MTQFGDHKVAQFVYEKDGKIISAFAVPSEVLRYVRLGGDVMFDGEVERVTARKTEGFENMMCFHKRTKDGCLFVSNLPPEEFLKLMG